jgi:hypothetical protein
VTSSFKKVEEENKQMKDQLSSKSLQVSRVTDYSQQNHRRNYQENPGEQKRYIRIIAENNNQKLPLNATHFQRGYSKPEDPSEQTMSLKDNKQRSPTEKFVRSMVVPEDSSKSSKVLPKSRWQNLQRRV